MIFSKSTILAFASLLLCATDQVIAVSPDAPKPLSDLQRDLVNLRFGMFIHLSPATYLDVANQLQSDHAPPRQGKDGILGTADDLSPALLNPTKLDCGQWADASKSAGMKFAVLTTKHHDGFCLWPSKYSTYTVAQGCQRDIVREFTEAFRKRGLKVGLYYSIRDRTERISGVAEQGGVSPEKIQLIKNQLAELLTNYGEILYIVFDAWGNTWHESPTFYDIPYADIYNHIKSLQPNCLVLNHTRIRAVSDVPHIELNAHMGLPTGADWPAVGGDTIQGTWFWRTNFSSDPLRSVDWILQENLIPDNLRNVVFQLNCAPNREGLFDDNVLDRLAEVGKVWTPPPPLQTIPDSWKNWPVPESIRLFAGQNIAKGKPVRFSPAQKIKTAESLVDGNPKSHVDLGGTNAWLEIDLGRIESLSGIRIWNRAAAKNVILEHGFVFVSEKTFQSDDLTEIQRQSGVIGIAITEPTGYPTPYPVGKSGRYIRIVSDTGRPIGIGEVEVFAATGSTNISAKAAPAKSSAGSKPARAEAGSVAEKHPKDLRFQPDPALPNVLLLGDSISIGYTLPVRNLLKGKANVFRPVDPDGTAINCSDTAKGLADLDRWLAAQPKWSVIHFNWGLHDLKHMKNNAAKPTPSGDPNDPALHTAAEYRGNLEKIVARLQATGARLVFATTTPVPAGCNNPFRSPDDPPRYNAAAVEIMKAHGIRVDDLHTLMVSREPELQLPGNVHFTADGSAVMASRVAQIITSELEVNH